MLKNFQQPSFLTCLWSKNGSTKDNWSLLNLFWGMPFSEKRTTTFIFGTFFKQFARREERFLLLGKNKTSLANLR